MPNGRGSCEPPLTCFILMDSTPFWGQEVDISTKKLLKEINKPADISKSCLSLLKLNNYINIAFLRCFSYKRPKYPYSLNSKFLIFSLFSYFVQNLFLFHTSTSFNFISPLLFIKYRFEEPLRFQASLHPSSQISRRGTRNLLSAYSQMPCFQLSAHLLWENACFNKCPPKAEITPLWDENDMFFVSGMAPLRSKTQRSIVLETEDSRPPSLSISAPLRHLLAFSIRGFHLLHASTLLFGYL